MGLVVSVYRNAEITQDCTNGAFLPDSRPLNKRVKNALSAPPEIGPLHHGRW